MLQRRWNWSLPKTGWRTIVPAFVSCSVIATNCIRPYRWKRRASGLLALTQDWHVNRKLVDNGARVETEYVVEVAGELAPDGLAALNSGLSYNGSRPAAIKVSWQNETRLRFAIKGVQAGQIEHLCKAVGLTVLSIKRIRIGRVPMAALPVGQWRYLLGYERF